MEHSSLYNGPLDPRIKGPSRKKLGGLHLTSLSNWRNKPTIGPISILTIHFYGNVQRADTSHIRDPHPQQNGLPNQALNTYLTKLVATTFKNKEKKVSCYINTGQPSLKGSKLGPLEFITDWYWLGFSF